MDFSATTLYGATPQAPAYSTPAAPTQSITPVDNGVPGGWQGLVHPDNPLFWAGVVIAVALGGIGVSGSVRLASAKASGSVGKA